jgi:resuscitation-promoting factor RpfC
MTFTSIAVGGVAKALIGVTISLHPGSAAAAHQAADHVTVKPGDTLSSISQREYGSASDWPALWWVNRHRVPEPGTVRAGQRLRVSDWHKVRPWLTRAALAAMPAPPPVAVPSSQPVSMAGTISATPVPAQSSGTYSAAPGSFQSCVIQAESGGNASAVNPSSGAGGLYQFLPSTWASLGYASAYPGGAQTAPASVQQQAFDKLYAESGSAPWSSDGC